MQSLAQLNLGLGLWRKYSLHAFRNAFLHLGCNARVNDTVEVTGLGFKLDNVMMPWEHGGRSSSGFSWESQGDNEKIGKGCTRGGEGLCRMSRSSPRGVTVGGTAGTEAQRRISE